LDIVHLPFVVVVVDLIQCGDFCMASTTGFGVSPSDRCF